MATAYEIKFRPSAKREFKKLPSDIQQRIAPKIDALADNPRPFGCSRLTGMDAYRIRVGDYRIIYEIRDAELVVLVVRIAHRREVYDYP
jgi:mRNA interferase RelE/StbE